MLLISYFLIYEGIPVQDIISDALTNLNWQTMLRIAAATVFYLLPILSLNSIFYNLKMIFSIKKTKESPLLENNILIQNPNEKFNIIKLSCLVNAVYGFLINISLIFVIIAFMKSYEPSINSEDIIILSLISLFALFGVLILLDSVKSYNKLK